MIVSIDNGRRTTDVAPDGQRLLLPGAVRRGPHVVHRGAELGSSAEAMSLGDGAKLGSFEIGALIAEQANLPRA